MEKKFFVSRPTVTAELMQLGYEPTICRNPYEPDRKMWEFPLSVEFAQDVQRIYTERGIKIPAAINNTLKGVE